MIETFKKSRRLHTLRSTNPDKGFTLITSVDFVKVCTHSDVLSSYLVCSTSLYQHDLSREDVATTEFTRSIFSLPDSASSADSRKCFAKEFKRAHSLAYREHTHYQEIFYCFNS